MVVEERIQLHEKSRLMMFSLVIILCIASGIATLIFFFLYIKARMAGLDRQERRYLSLHFIMLFLFVLFGILILIHLSDSINSGTTISAVDTGWFPGLSLFPDQLSHFL